MMRNEMRLVKYKPYLESNKTVAETLRSDFYNLEASQSSFSKLATDPGKNHVELLKHARAFHSQL